MLIPRLLTYANLAIILVITCTTGKALAAAQPHRASVNFVEIKTFAAFANAAYQTLPKVRELSQLKNHALSDYGTIPDINISYFLATNDSDKTQIIAVRGTTNIENAMIDIAVKLTSNKHTGIRLHEGFSQTAEMIYKEIRPLIKPGYVISTTGHSLGGAVALILAMRLDADNFKIGQVVTFGQPKVTNISGARKFQHLNVTRVVTPKDLVPLVPPFDPVDFNDMDIYWHLGKEVVLLADTTYALLEGMNSMLRATNFTQAPLDESNLKNHQMALYMEMVDKKTSSARLVPFKNNFNLFNLFGSAEK